MILDLNGFKAVNDRLGHGAGDRLLAIMADRLTRRLRETDTIARLGGDEFALLIENLAKPEHAALVARKLLDTVAPPVELGEQQVSVTASLGVALYPRDGGEAVELVRQADRAMYRAKAEGGNLCRFSSDQLERRVQRGRAARDRSAARPRARRAAPALSAAGDAPGRRARHLGDGPLGPSGARPDRPGALPAARRGRRPAAADDRVAARSRVRPGPTLVRARNRADASGAAAARPASSWPGTAWPVACRITCDAAGAGAGPARDRSVRGAAPGRRRCRGHGRGGAQGGRGAHRARRLRSRPDVVARPAAGRAGHPQAGARDPSGRARRPPARRCGPGADRARRRTSACGWSPKGSTATSSWRSCGAAAAMRCRPS